MKLNKIKVVPIIVQTAKKLEKFLVDVNYKISELNYLEDTVQISIPT